MSSRTVRTRVTRVLEQYVYYSVLVLYSGMRDGGPSCHVTVLPSAVLHTGVTLKQIMTGANRAVYYVRVQCRVLE
jgi:hypothetical protein